MLAVSIYFQALVDVKATGTIVVFYKPRPAFAFKPAVKVGTIMAVFRLRVTFIDVLTEHNFWKIRMVWVETLVAFTTESPRKIDAFMVALVSQLRGTFVNV